MQINDTPFRRVPGKPRANLRSPAARRAPAYAAAAAYSDFSDYGADIDWSTILGSVTQAAGQIIPAVINGTKPATASTTLTAAQQQLMLQQQQAALAAQQRASSPFNVNNMSTVLLVGSIGLLGVAFVMKTMKKGRR